MRKAPGPDGMTAELLKHGGMVTLEMTVRLTPYMGATDSTTRNVQSQYLPPSQRRSDAKNPMQQRPISLTNIWTKVIDKLLYEKLMKHTIDNDILSPNQAGFRKHHSCTT